MVDPCGAGLVNALISAIVDSLGPLQLHVL